MEVCGDALPEKFVLHNCFDTKIAKGVETFSDVKKKRGNVFLGGGGGMFVK